MIFCIFSFFIDVFYIDVSNWWKISCLKHKQLRCCGQTFIRSHEPISKYNKHWNIHHLVVGNLSVCCNASFQFYIPANSTQKHISSTAWDFTIHSGNLSTESADRKAQYIIPATVSIKIVFTPKEEKTKYANKNSHQVQFKQQLNWKFHPKILQTAKTKRLFATSW